MKHLSFESVLLLASLALATPQPGFGQSVSERQAARLLDQATWGPTPEAIAAVERMGIEEWLSVQFRIRGSDLPDQPLLNSAGNTNTNLAPVQAAFFRNAVGGHDQLRQRMAYTLSQIWVVSATAGVPNAYAYPPYWRIFRDHAFGNYRDLIKAVTLSPAMGRYLNMANNNKGNAAKGTSANENYARELMQLFTLGLTKLNQEGSPVLDANRSPVPTYNQSDVTNLARALTGWTYPTAPGATVRVNNPAYYFGPMIAVETEHDTTAKTIFGNLNLPAGQTAEQDLESVLDALMKQPTMAPFISQQLIQHLVTSNPSAGYIERVAKVFEDDGSGVSGNLRAVVKAILTDDEARAADSSPAVIASNFGHLREPILMMANILRGLDATVGQTNGITGATTNMSQELFYAPSVFSYFSPQYRTKKGLLGPEFQIYSTQTAANRAGVINTILYGTMSGVKVNLAPYVALAGNSNDLMTHIANVFLHGAVSPQLQGAAVTAVNAATTPLAKAQAALYIVLTSSEYQIVQ